VAAPTSNGGPAIAVGHDTNANVVSFYAADGTTLGTVEVPGMLKLERQVLPSRFVYGRSLDGPLTVIDASTMTVSSYQLDADFTAFTEVNSTVVAAYSADYVATSDVVLIDLATGTMTSLRGLIGRPTGRWGRTEPVDDALVVFTDTEVFRSTVIPRADPMSAWEADSVIGDVAGDTYVGRQLDTQTQGQTVRLYRGPNHAPVKGAWDSIEPTDVAGVYLLDDSEMVVASRSGELTGLDLETGTTRNVGTLGASPDYVLEIAGSIAVVSGGGGAALFDDSVIEPIEVNDGGNFFSAGSGPACALIDRYRSPAADSKSSAFVINLQSMKVVAELGADPIQLSADGCSATDSLRATAVVNGEEFDLDHGWLFDVDEAQTSILLRARDNITRIVHIADRTAVDLPPAFDFQFVEVDAPDAYQAETSGADRTVVIESGGSGRANR
jgi:hypothetical protein